MARDDNNKPDRYKEGVDFEWVQGKNGNYKTRRFFTKAEKAERASGGKKKKAEADKPSTKKSSAPESSPRPRPRPSRTSETSPKPRPERTTKKSDTSTSDKRETERRRKPKGAPDGESQSKRIIPAAAVFGASKPRTSPRFWNPRQIRQRPVPFDSGVSRSTEVGRPNPRGGSMFMLNGGRDRLGAPPTMRGLPKPKLQ